MPIPRCEWKGTTALTLATLAVTGLSIYSIMRINETAQEICESEFQKLIDSLKNTTFTTPAIDNSVTETITIPGMEVRESDGVVIHIPSRKINITIPINIPSFALSLSTIVGENIMEKLDSIPAQLGKLCADEVTLHAASYAGIIVLFFVLLTLGYACITHTNKKMQDLENRLDFLNRSSPSPKETTHLLAFAHRKNHSF